MSSPRTRARGRVALALTVAGVSAAALVPAAAGAAGPPLDLEALTGPEAVKKMEAGELTSVQLTQAYIDRITALNKRGPGLNAVTQFNKAALTEAAAADARRAAGIKLGPADGLPILMKDLIDVKGMYTSNGNYSLRNSFPADDAGITKKLRASGVVILGKLGLSEYANSFGNQPSGFSNLTGQVLNGLDADQNPSGSSSGTGSAGAAALSSLTIGTETSGSITSPSNANGLVGLRPTVGLVPGYGIGPISASQDIAGPMDRTVSEAAMNLQSIAGPDPKMDAGYAAMFGDEVDTVIPKAPATVPDYMSALKLDFVQGKRIGYTGAGVPADGTPLKRAYDALVAAGATLVPVSQTNPVGLPALPAGYEQHKSIDNYYANLGPDAPIKSLEEEIADNAANPMEALKFGNGNHVNAAASDTTPGGPTETTYRTNVAIRKAAWHKSLDDVLDRGTPETGDDVVAVIGSLSNTPQAGYPQTVIPMGYNDTQRRTLNVSVYAGAYGERDLIGVSYVIEQATKLRKKASEVNPSMYRCAKTVPAPAFSERGDCNPDYDTIMAKVGERPSLPFALETESVEGLQDRLAAGTLSSETLTKAYLARIALSNAEGPATQAVRSVNLDAIDQAKAADAKRAEDGNGGPLSGIPVLVDDTIDVAGVPTTAGSIALQRSVPTKDAKIVQRLKAGGAIILGKTNVSELGGVLDQNAPEGYSSLGGQVLVPSDTDKTPGGSSAGSAAATASGLAAVAIGLETSTDTAQLVAPAGINGVVGLKPTVGRISRSGVLGVAKTQDAPGPITRTVHDAAASLQVLAARDTDDPATASAPLVTGDYTAGLRTNALEGKRVAVVASNTAPYPDVVTTLQDLGATTTVKTVGAPTASPSIVRREFERDLNAYLAGTGGTGAKTLSQIIDYNAAHPEEGLKYQQGELVEAQAVDLDADATYATDRDTGRTESRSVIDTILTNGTPETTDDFDAVVVPSGNGLVNIADRAGYPVLTVPAGFGTGSAGRNPIGVTFVGTAYSEAKLLAAGYAFEQASKVRRAPSVTNPSMWRCVPGSAFFSPHHCNPGDRSSTFAFTPLPAEPPAVTPETPGTPGTPGAPGTPAPGAPATPGTPARPATPAKKVAIKLASRSVRIDRKGRFGVRVTCPKGAPSCRVRILVKRTSATVGSRTITIKGGTSFTVNMRPSESMRRILRRGRSVTVKVSFTGYRGLTVPAPTTIKVAPRKAAKG